MSCQTSGCTEPATDRVTLAGADRDLCGTHTLAAVAWAILDAPDLDPRPHESRPCVICREGDRAPGRAVCEPCRDRAYAVHAAGANR